MATTHDRKRWSSWRTANFCFFEEHLSKLPTEKTLIDIGAGPEQFRELTWRFKKTSVDFKQFGTTDVVADLEKEIPLPADSADIVYMSNVLEHLPYAEITLSETHRILKRGGLLIGAVPFLAAVHQAPYDYKRYTIFGLKRILAEAGFTDIEITPIGRPTQLYRNMQDVMFRYLPRTITMWMYQKIERLSHNIFSILLRNQPISADFCQGYGFRAIK